MKLSSKPVLDCKESLCLDMLRYVHPEWSWVAIHFGFGYRYEGCRGGKKVTVRRCALMVGDDVYRTIWVVEETAESFAAWSARESIRNAQGAK